MLQDSALTCSLTDFLEYLPFSPEETDVQNCLSKLIKKSPEKGRINTNIDVIVERDVPERFQLGQLYQLQSTTKSECVLPMLVRLSSVIEDCETPSRILTFKLANYCDCPLNCGVKHSNDKITASIVPSSFTEDGVKHNVKDIAVASQWRRNAEPEDEPEDEPEVT